MNAKASPALLKIKLPSLIVVPVDCDLNALFEFMAKAKVIEEVLSSNDPHLTGTSMYSGPSTYFADGPALPSVEGHKGKLYDSQADAQLAKNEIVASEIAARASVEASSSEEAA